MSWNEIAGFGIAGNFTGHLEQAGEAQDFTAIKTNNSEAPKGIFPFYLPHLNTEHYLSTNPYSHDKLILLNDTDDHQIEPEMSILFSVKYDNNKIISLSPQYAMAHNDCSIRRAGAKKISEKKNWGACSKGVSQQRIPIQNLSKGGILDHYQLTCFLRRDGILHQYGITSPVKNYSYFYQQLIAWSIDTLNEQKDHGPLEDLSTWLEKAKHPETICISIGATKYTEFGATTFLKAGDQSIVVLFDSRFQDTQSLKRHIQEDTIMSLPNISVLSQAIVSPSS